MNNKYIIKNCNVIFRNGDFYFCQSSENLAKNVYCQDCTDCILKRIVELCKEVNTKFYDSVHQRYLSPSKAKFARQILELLYIEEVK